MIAIRGSQSVEFNSRGLVLLTSLLLVFIGRKASPKYLRRSPYNWFRRYLGMNTTWYLNFPFVWLRLSILSIMKFPFVCWEAHVGEFPQWTPVSVTLLPPPRQGRGISRLY